MTKAQTYRSLLDKANEASNSKDFKVATDLYKKAIDVGFKKKDHDFIAYALLLSSNNYRTNEQISECKEQIKEVISIAKDNFEPEGLATVQLTSAHISSSIMDYENAIRYARTAFDTALSENIKSTMADSMNLMSNLNEMSMRLNNAIYYLQKSIEYYQQSNISYAQSRALSNLGLLYAQKGDFLQALNQAALGQSVGLEKKSDHELKYNAFVQCRIYQMIGDSQNARNFFEQGTKYEVLKGLQLDPQLHLLSSNCSLGFRVYNYAYVNFFTMYDAFTKNNLLSYIPDTMLGIARIYASVFIFDEAGKWFRDCVERIPIAAMPYRTNTIYTALDGLLSNQGHTWDIEKRNKVILVLDNIRQLAEEDYSIGSAVTVKALLIMDNILSLIHGFKKNLPRVFKRPGITIKLDENTIDFDDEKESKEFTPTELAIFKALVQNLTLHLDNEALFSELYKNETYHKNMAHSIQVHIHNMNNKIRPYLEIKGSYGRGYKLTVPEDK